MANQWAAWPDLHSDALKTFVGRGYSYAQAGQLINKEFGSSYTRNACIGRGQRMGLRSSAASGPKQFLSPEGRKVVRARREAERRAGNPEIVKRAARARREKRRTESRRIEALIVMKRNCAKPTSPAYRKHLPRLPEMTRTEMRAMLTQAVQNTAAMGVT